ncbi:MAG: hypothetical protein ACK5YH_01345 [Pseudanabaena sp.]|jgi:hypothetical protein
MHQSSLATITENGIKFSVDILNPLSIKEGTEVYGIYYPTPPGYQFNESYHDIVLTAVPYHCWPFAARFRIWLKHQVPGGLYALTQTFKDHGMSIISTEASRSGHRYATCTATVCIDSLMHEYPEQMLHDINAFNEIKDKIKERINNCLQDIKKRCNEYLFSSTEALGLENPAIGERLDALSYFYERTVNEKKEGKNEIYWRPWHFTYKKGVLKPGVQSSSFMRYALSDALPSRAFAEMNTRDANIRLVVIRTHELRQFGWVSLKYTWQIVSQENSNHRSNKPVIHSSLGIASEINRLISEDYNIWRFLDYVNTMERCFEEGSMEFFLRKIVPHASNWELLKKRLESAKLDVPGVIIKKVSVTPISFMRIFLSTRASIEKRRGLRSICASVGSQYGMLEEDFRIVETYTRGVIPSVVREIRDSHAMIQYYGCMESDPNNYDWLHAELLAAQVLDMPVVAIVEEGTPREKIKTLGDRAVLKISRDPSDETVSKAIEKALAEINNARFEID